MDRVAAALQPFSRQIVTAQVVTTSAASAVFEIPNDAAELQLIVQVSAASGTSPVLDVALQMTPDNGTLWTYTGNKMLQVTGTGQRVIAFSRMRHAGQAAAEFSGDLPAAAAAAAATNGPLTRKCRLWFIVGGTTPSFTINAWLVGNPPTA